MKIVRGIQKDYLRVCIYGVPGIGKTTMASQFPKPLFFDFEEGSKQLDVDRVVIKDWKDFIDAVKELKKSDYQTIVIDTVDWMISCMCDYHIAKDYANNVIKDQSIEGYGYGKGYKIMAEHFSRTLNELREIKKNVLFLSHAYVKRIAPPNDEPYDRYEMLREEGKCMKAPFMECLDAIFFVNWRVDVITDANKKKTSRLQGRQMHTQHGAAFDAKNRFGMPSVMPFEISAFEKVFSAMILDGNTPTQTAKQEPAPIQSPVDAKKFEWSDLGIDLEQIKEFLVIRGVITSDQTLDDIPDSYLQRVAGDPNKFVQAMKAVMGEKQ